jgi:ring-1,2-phenylacetyl-CoA epoxidase subunit PaaE
MMKTVLPEEPKSRFTLFYGNRQTPTIIFREDLEALKNRYMDRLSIYHIMTAEDLGSDLMTGRMDKEKISKLASVLFDPALVDDYYMCGPEPIIHAACEVLSEKGVPEDRVHFELFTSSVKLEDTEQKVVEARKAEEKKVHAKIKLVMDGDEFEFALDSDGKTILDAASEAGIDVPYSCKGAVCCTCIARVKDGEAVMEKNYSLTDKEVAAGLILTCQAHPRTATVTVDYDDIW